MLNHYPLEKYFIEKLDFNMESGIFYYVFMITETFFELVRIC